MGSLTDTERLRFFCSAYLTFIIRPYFTVKLYISIRRIQDNDVHQLLNSVTFIIRDSILPKY